jgi:peptide/nickel transport system substrate-binding protein
MDNRFGVKDFFLFTLIAGLIILVLLAMKQFDRQFEKIRALEVRSSELATELSTINRQLSELPSQLPRGAAVQSGAAPAGQQTIDPKADPFYLVRAARALPDYAEGDWLIQNLGTRLGKVTPLIPGDIYGATVQARVVEPLIVRDPETLAWQPLLAQSFEIHPDGLGVTYNLRRNVRFSDGQPMTSADVKFTFDLIFNPELDAARSRSYLVDNGVTVETPDEFTVVFRLTKPYFEMLNITGATGVLPKHLYSKYKPSEINDNPGLLMGTGPYRLEGPDTWRPGQRLILYRNERYWGVPPAFKRIIYLEVQEETVYATMLRNGELDYTGVTPEQFIRLTKDPAIMARNNAFEFQSMLGGYTYVAWNQMRGGKPTPFADKRVRQAMTMLIDRERLAKELWYGYATVASGPFSSRGIQSDKAVKPWPYDPERAKALLKEAGYEDRNRDGLLEGPGGEEMKFEFMYSSGSALSERIALFLKDQLARGGVVLELKATDWPNMLERLKKSQFDMTSLGWSSSVESDAYQIFHSSQRGDAGDNRTNYANPELDKVIEEARSTVDAEKRMKLWNRVHQILHEDQPYTFLLERKSLALYDQRIKNVQTTRMGTNFMFTEPRVTPWYVPAGLQKHMEN